MRIVKWHGPLAVFGVGKTGFSVDLKTYPNGSEIILNDDKMFPNEPEILLARVKTFLVLPDYFPMLVNVFLKTG